MIQYLILLALLATPAVADASRGAIYRAEQEVRLAECELAEARDALRAAERGSRRDFGRRDALLADLRRAERARDAADACVIDCRRLADDLRRELDAPGGYEAERLRSQLRRAEQRVLSHVKRSHRWRWLDGEIDRADRDLRRTRWPRERTRIERELIELRREIGRLEEDALRRDRDVVELRRELAACGGRDRRLILAELDEVERKVDLCARDAADADAAVRAAARALDACPTVDLRAYELRVIDAQDRLAAAEERLDHLLHRGRGRPRDRYRR